MKKLQFIGMSFVAMTLVSCGPSLPQLGKNTIDEVIAAMTLEEKANRQCCNYCFLGFCFFTVRYKTCCCS